MFIYGRPLKCTLFAVMSGKSKFGALFVPKCLVLEFEFSKLIRILKAKETLRNNYFSIRSILKLKKEELGTLTLYHLRVFKKYRLLYICGNCLNLC